jgi:hypothetical protein
MNEQESIVVDMEVDTEVRVETDVKPLQVSENGTYEAPEGEAYSPVEVSVPVPELEPLSVEENGTYTPEKGHAFSEVAVNVEQKPRMVYCDAELPGPMGVTQVYLHQFYPEPEKGDYAFGTNGNYAVVSSIREDEQTALVRGCGKLFKDEPVFEDVTDDYNNRCDVSEISVLDWLLEVADRFVPTVDGDTKRVMVRDDRIAPDYAVYYAEFTGTLYKIYDADAFEWKEAIEMNVREVSFEGGDSEGDNTLRFYRYMNGELKVQWHVYFPEGKKVYDTPVSIPPESVAEAFGDMSAAQIAQVMEDLGAAPAEIVSTVSGATPTITPVAGTTYKCGELTSLTISNPPATGAWSVVFTSGSTATTTTIPGTVLGLESFAAEANTLYEINVLDNRAAVGSWVVSA